MGPSASEEQRFDFGIVDVQAPEHSGGRRPNRREVIARDEAADEAVAIALRRRVEEVAAVAHGARPAHVGEHDDAPAGLARLGITVDDRPFIDDVAQHPVDESIREPPEEFEEVDDDGLDEEVSLSVAQFYDRVRRALWGAFPEEVWVTGEIRGLKESRGHRYLELVDEGADSSGRGAAQQLEVVCWSREWPTVAGALMEAGVTLEVGRVVRVRGKVSVWEGGSKLRFTLTALDVEAMLGGIAAARRRLLLALEREGLLELNARTPLALVPLRIGVVTSPGSEGHRDFVGQLKRSGFAFVTRLEASLVQGPEAPKQVAAALKRLEWFSPDLVVVVRGGGARADLAAFDSEEIARAIALAPFPIWTGIGHTGDRAVADEVAQRSLITPTACGEAVVLRVAEYWDDTLRRATMLSRLARARLDGSSRALHAAAAAVTRATRHQLERRSDELVSGRSGVVRCIDARIDRESAEIRRRALRLGQAGERVIATSERDSRGHAKVLRAYDPARQLARGWSLTRDGSGRLVRSAGVLRPGDALLTRFLDGEVNATVASVKLSDADLAATLEQGPER